MAARPIGGELIPGRAALHQALIVDGGLVMAFGLVRAQGPLGRMKRVRPARLPAPMPWAGLFVLALALLGACGGDGERSAVGVIIDVQATSLTQVEAFTLRTNDGETLEFGVAPDAAMDPQEGFVASHLRSHASLAEQVKVVYREDGGELLALRLAHP